MPAQTVQLDLVDLAGVRRAADRRREAIDDGVMERKVLVIVNGKGGVGKSSLAAAIAVAIARTGSRVLLVEMDEQGNNGEDLGFTGKALDDGGQTQAAAILEGNPLQPTGHARTNLYVIPGGEALDEVVEELYVQRRHAKTTGDTAWMSMYAAALDQVRDDYDMIILDVAPGSDVLQMQALVAGDTVLIPSKSDPSSRKGLRTVARRFAGAREHNDLLELLGVVLFATNTSATKVQTNIKETLAADLKGAAPVFEQPIRHVEAAAVHARKKGKVPQELRSDPTLDANMKVSMKNLAADYQSLAIELMQALNDLKDSDDGLEDEEAEQA